MSRHFCTLFDRNYLLKGVAMLRSLAKHCPDAHVHVLCMDEETQGILGRLSLPHITSIALTDFEDDALRAVKADRNIAEYCWTLSPCLPTYLLERNPGIDSITYVDADLMFFSSLEPLFAEIGSSSLAITEHRFSPRYEPHVVNGRFCVQWVSFRRNEEATACLARWRAQCIEWCYDRVENGRMGDQKYLDEWPSRYPSCHIVQHLGVGVAPWNYAQYRFEQDKKGGVTINGAPLILYHFHQFQLLTSGRFERVSEYYRAYCREPGAVYRAYETLLRTVIREVRCVSPGFSHGMKVPQKVPLGIRIRRLVPKEIRKLIKGWFAPARSLG